TDTGQCVLGAGQPAWREPDPVTQLGARPDLRGRERGQPRSPLVMAQRETRPRCSSGATGAGPDSAVATQAAQPLGAGHLRQRPLVAGTAQRPHAPVIAHGDSPLRVRLGNHDSGQRHVWQPDPEPGHSALAARVRRAHRRHDPCQRQQRTDDRKRPTGL
nr:hypothetical protein [Tanacetum cinerariifolium]